LGDGVVLNDEVVDFWFLIGFLLVWNGIMMGVIDIVWCYMICKCYVDVGMCVVDYLMI